MPFGSVPRGLGDGSWGLQINLPFSKQTGDWYWHWNAGLTWLPQADLDDTREENLMSPFVAGSAIYRIRPMFNVMLESVLLSQELVGDTTTFRETAFTLSPGVRGGWNVGDQQLILGVAFPTTWAADESETGVFLYASYELPFRR
jgi:hypothetical protein